MSLVDVEVRMSGRTALHGVTWTLRHGESWAVIGGNGSGKTSFLRLVRGEIWPLQGGGARLYHHGSAPSPSPIGLRERTGLLSPEVVEEWRRRAGHLTGMDVVLTGSGDTPFLYREPSPVERARAAQLLAGTGAGHLADAVLARMSEGQARLTLLLRALFGNPVALFLDEFGDGLDRAMRRRVLELLRRLRAEGMTLVVASHREDELAELADNKLFLCAGRVVAALPDPPSSADLRQQPVPALAAPARAGRPRGDRLVEIENATVRLEGVDILKGISLALDRGGHLRIDGPNGSGKSTLLRLLAGELHPLPGAVVRRFGSEAPLPLDEIRRRTGLASFTLQEEFPAETSGLDVVASAYLGTYGLLPGSGLAADPGLPAAEALRERARAVLAGLGLDALADKAFGRLSYGQRRRLLLARALAHAPEVLLLDEPFSGLDAAARRELALLLLRVAETGATLVVVTHRPEDLPQLMFRKVVLNAGRINSMK